MLGRSSTKIRLSSLAATSIYDVGHYVKEDRKKKSSLSRLQLQHVSYCVCYGCYDTISKLWEAQRVNLNKGQP